MNNDNNQPNNQPTPTFEGQKMIKQVGGDISEALNTMEARHQQSKIEHPEINLSPGEYVIQTVRRHPIGLLSIWLMAGFLSVVLFAALPLYALNQAAASEFIGMELPQASILFLPILILVGIFLLGGLIQTVIYQGNRFYLTNESVIQHVKTGLFDEKVQIINLVNVEDVSYEQKGLIEQIFNYGTIRLSTQGQETIYHFYFVATPHKVVNSVNDAIEVAMDDLEGRLRAHQMRE